MAALLLLTPALPADSQELRGRITGVVTAMMDLFNALNENPITGFRTVTGARFKEVTAVLDPRAARFGVRWEF